MATVKGVFSHICTLHISNKTKDQYHMILYAVSVRSESGKQHLSILLVVERFKLCG